MKVLGRTADLHYSEEDDVSTGTTGRLALCDIHLTIHSGEKVAVCGRTGSGKFSVIALLLKPLNPTSVTAEKITIDGMPLCCVDRLVLRQRIIAVPQEAVFFPDGSIYIMNLNPSNASTVAECEGVVRAVGLWSFIQECGGLQAGMATSMLSAGQRQLMSLGRALIMRRVSAQRTGAATSSPMSGVMDRGMLLLDEVSSSVDYATERAMEEFIRTEFRDYTVISVTHRIDMIMGFDRVVVMETGEVVEVGNPRVLARKEGTKFRDLVRAKANERGVQVSTAAADGT